MFATKLKLVGYTRIGQNGIHTLEVDFTKIMQIILGGNGSGKSSIKEQLSPLPPVTSSEFSKGGYKEFHFHDSGSNWIAISDYGERNGHYLECDGEVLNNWGTALVQKSLIEQHFGLTQEIFDVLCGSKKFTHMSPIERRDWVMRLSNLNINPLMSKFMESKNRLRDSKAYMTKIAERLKIEVKNTVSETNLIDLQDSLQALKDEFGYYSKFSEEIVITQSDSLEHRSAELLDFMDNLMGMFPKVPKWALDLGIKSTSDIKDVIIADSAKLDTLKLAFADSMKELSEINKVAEAKAKLEGVGIDESKLKLHQLEERATTARVMLQRFDYKLDGSCAIARNDFLRILTDLRQRMFQLPVNDNYSFNSESYKQAQGLEFSYMTRANQLKQEIYQREHLIKHIDDTDDSTCPQCEYTYKQGVGVNDRSRALQELQNLNEQLAGTNKLITETKQFLEDCGEYIEEIRSIYTTMQLTPSNEGLWVPIRQLEIFKNNPYPAIDLLDRHLEYLEIGCELEEINALKSKEEDILNKALQALEIVNSANTENISKIDERVFNQSNEITHLESRLTKLKMMFARFKHIDEQVDKLSGMFDDFNLIYLNTLDNDRSKFIKETKFNIMKEINYVEQELEQAKVKNMIYKDIEKEYEKAKQEFSDYTIITENLSPNTGLIADIMNGSIGDFVSNLNGVISAVWTSDVVVLPCVNKKNDLDWKFPVQVEKGVVRSDALKTSTSQKDIINLSFQLVVGRHVGSARFPLYLDELGSSMDDQHRINMMHVVSDLVEHKQCSQLFFISHFAAFHEQFNNNETLVVNTKNIINLPKVFNQHAKFS